MLIHGKLTLDLVMLMKESRGSARVRIGLSLAATGIRRARIPRSEYAFTKNPEAQNDSHTKTFQR